MHALRRIHQVLAPGGMLIDTQPVSARPPVFSDDSPLGTLDMREWLETIEAIDALVAGTIDAGLYTLEREQRLLVVDTFDNGRELVETVSEWRGTHISRALSRRVAATTTPVTVTQEVRLRVLRNRAQPQARWLSLGALAYTRGVPLRKNAKIELLRRTPLFSSCSKRELAEIATIADEIDLSPGKVLTRQGERGREFFVLLEGEAEVHRNGRKLATRRAGEFFGEIALVSDRPRVATVTATTPLRALVIRDTEFRALVRSTPQIALKVLEAFADRLPIDAA